jgi:hypothetical protein
MRFTDEQFDRAFAEFQEFGPRRRIRVEERWRDGLQDISADEFPALLARCKEIENFAVGLAEQVRDGNITQDSARLELERTYPFLTNKRLDRMWSQAMYFSLK